MVCILFSLPGGRLVSGLVKSDSKTKHLKQTLVLSEGLGDEEFRLVYNGRSLHDDDVPFDGGDVPSYPTLHVHLRVRGGKGGFGSMLRAMGSQRSGHETDNIESCRDLSGRRIRHVNDEKKIAEWMSKQNEREALAVELAERKAEKRQRALTQPKHNYDHHGLLIEQNESADKVDEGVRAGFAASLIHSKRLLDGPIREKKTSKVAFGGGWDCSDSDDSRSDSDAGPAVEPVKEVTVPGIQAALADAPTRFQPISSLEEQVLSATKTQDNTFQSETNSTSIQQPSKKAKVSHSSTAAVNAIQLDLGSYKSVKELEAEGLDRLKSALKAAGLKCGGSLRERAERLFSVKGLSEAEYPADVHAASN